MLLDSHGREKEGRLRGHVPATYHSFVSFGGMAGLDQNLPGFGTVMAGPALLRLLPASHHGTVGNGWLERAK